MAISEINGPSAFGAGAAPGNGRWVAQQVARPRTRVDPATADDARWVEPRPQTPPLELVLATARPDQGAIDRPPPSVGIREVLTAWRVAERELGAIPECSPEWPDVHARLVTLRASYHQLFNESRDRRPGVDDRWRDGGRPEMTDGFQHFEAR